MQKVHVLNLPRRHDRRERFLRDNSHDGLEIEWIDAIDGQRLRFDELVRDGIVGAYCKHFTAGSLGCGCSHKMMWERCLSEDRPIIVCEDDAILRADFPHESQRILEELPDGWEIVTFGYNFDSVIDVELFAHQQLRGVFSKHSLIASDLSAFVRDERRPRCLPLKNAFGLCAYAVSPKGAERLLELCFPMTGMTIHVPALRQSISPTMSIDAIMNAHYAQLSAFTVVPPLAVSPNDPQASDTLHSAPAEATATESNESPPSVSSCPAPGPAAAWFQRIHGADPYQDFAFRDYPVDLQQSAPHPVFAELVEKLRPRLVLEVGSWKGDTAIALASAIKKLQLDAVVLCVDTWLGSVEHVDGSIPGWDIRPYCKSGFPRLYQQFLANVMHHACQDRIVPFPNTSTNAARWLFHNRVLADLIYIDASHEEEEVYLDLCLYWKVLRPGGVMFGDDWSAFWYGVICAVNRFAKERELSFQVIRQKWILQKPAR